MIAAVIVAAGQGLRMGAGRPKQFLPLGGKSILKHTLDHFLSCRLIDQIIIVLGREEIKADSTVLASMTAAPDRIKWVAGGENRQKSVYNGLQAIPAQEGIVLIHDGVRPLISSALIEACIQGARQWDACIPAVAVTDTLKQVDDRSLVTGTVARHGLWSAQTPQAFKLSLIRAAHRQAVADQYQGTDDAALVERLGIAVKVIPGLVDNIKITTPQDLRLAEAVLSMTDD